MKQFRLIFILTLIFCTTVLAQPRFHWVKNYGDGTGDYFYDVFLTLDDGYAMCGRDDFNRETQAWINVTDAEGDNILVYNYRDGDVSQFNSIIEVEGGGFLAGGYIGVPQIFWAVRIDEDGNEIFRRQYNDAHTGFCYSVIELKNGTFMLAGRSGDYGMLVNIENDGQVIWQEMYGNVGAHTFYSMRETEDEILVAGVNESENALIVKVNAEDGEVIWDRFYYPEDWEDHITSFRSIISIRGGFVLVGENVMPLIDDEWASWYWFVRISNNGSTVFNKSYDIGINLRGTQKKLLYSVTPLPDGGFAAVGNGQSEGEDGSEEHGIIVKVDYKGRLVWHKTYPLLAVGVDNFYAQSLYSVITHPDGSVITVGRGRQLEDDLLLNPAGILLKLIPEQSGPFILSYIPENNEFSTLIGDTILFSVEAMDQQEDSLRYIWTVDEDTVGILDSVFVHFDELRDWEVSCIVSDGDLEASVTWLVQVKDFHISTYIPDRLNFTIRRDTEIDFSIGVRAIEGIEPEYAWSMNNRNQRQEDLGEEAETSYHFDLHGEYRLTGTAIYEGREQSIHWQISVKSLLWWWWPRAKEFETPINREIEFTMILNDLELESLEFKWYIDGRNQRINDYGMLHVFPDPGEFLVVGIARDRAAADTVVWTVTVYHPDDVADDPAGLLPSEVTLYAAAPNPFNSSTSIRYFLPQSSDVQLSVYDSAGRLVHSLSDGWQFAGDHHTTLQGSDLATGVYLFRLEAGGTVQTGKVVLLK